LLPSSIPNARLETPDLNLDHLTLSSYLMKETVLVSEALLGEVFRATRIYMDRFVGAKLSDIKSWEILINQ
jgi:hypothetical protein